jgi:hypothetical protein
VADHSGLAASEAYDLRRSNTRMQAGMYARVKSGTCPLKWYYGRTDEARVVFMNIHTAYGHDDSGDMKSVPVVTVKVNPRKRQSSAPGHGSYSLY